MLRLVSKYYYRQSVMPIKFGEEYLGAPMNSTPFFAGESIKAKPAQHEITKLTNGLTILTESVTVPSVVDIGILINAGPRDETLENSGATLLLKNAYLKTAINTNETVNYGIYQMSGGEYECDYTRENMYYQASCLSHDVVDVFNMVADCAFEPKTVIAVNLGAHKNKDSHKLEGSLGYNTTFNDNIYQTAYGLKGLGMPLLGRKNNIGNLLVDTIQNFQASFITPARVIISAAGVDNHKEFVELVNLKLRDNHLSSKETNRAKSVYVGGEVKELTEANAIHIAIAFEGACHANSLPLQIAQQILSERRKQGRIVQNVLKNVFVDDAQAFSANYTDSGLFGLKISGSASHGKQILEVAAKELAGLKTITPKDFELAKMSLKGTISRVHTATYKRLEQNTKSLFYLGKTIESHTALINAVTLEQVQGAVKKALESKVTIVARGGEANRLPGYEAVSALFK